MSILVVNRVVVLCCVSLTLVLAWSASAAESKVLIPTARQKGAMWRYTTKGPAAGWMKPSFDDSTWKKGQAGFGVKDFATPAETIGTAWKTPGIWMRKEIALPGRPEFKTAALTVRHDEDVKVYLNGRLIFEASGFNTKWTVYDITKEVRGALAQGRNVVAVQVSQSSGGQYIDVGLELDAKRRPARKAGAPVSKLAEGLRELLWPSNYLPRTAVNSTEMWQAETFDAKTIDQELGWAQKAGYNGVRVFLQYVVWKADADGLKQRLGEFLAIAARHKIGVMPIFFCDCSFGGREPYLGKQKDPVPGVHNSGWVPSPGLKRVTDRSAWPDLERYVKDILGRFGQDPRVAIWDLYNEPGNSGMGSKSLPLAVMSFRWAREAKPSQPITIAAWSAPEGTMSKWLMELSDVVSFHAYSGPKGVEARVRVCAAYGRPVVCTEWLHRQSNNTFQTILPIFAKHRVGWYHWGLVAGRTQTYMHWGSRKGSPVPKVWQHDVFHPDGKPYDAKELEMVRAFRFSK
jgi:hypothetical protein